MAYVVVYDACVLYPAALRDLLVRIAQTGIVRARWSESILDECFENILKNRDDLNSAALARTRELMNNAVRDCIVSGYERIIPNLELPDPNDRHVLAAAIRASAQGIVTFNLGHFPEAQLAEYDIEARHPDDFVLDMIGLGPATIVRVITEQAAALRSPPTTIPTLLDTLREQRLVQSVAHLRELFGVSS